MAERRVYASRTFDVQRLSKEQSQCPRCGIIRFAKRNTRSLCASCHDVDPTFGQKRY